MAAVDLESLVSFARSVAIEAGRLTHDYYRSGVPVELKGDDSPVTQADREAEALLRSRIRERYPAHGILGEEFGVTPGRGEYSWILDPIDGTRSFVAQVPFYSVLVALVRGPVREEMAPLPSDDVLAGVIHLPEMGETVSAARGLGAFWTRSGSTIPARVSSIGTLAEARILTTDFADLARRSPSLFETTLLAAQTRTWGDAAGYALVATGRAEAMIDPIMSPWDVGPLPVIIEEAGGTFTDLRGERVLGNSSFASNGQVPLPIH